MDLMICSDLEQAIARAVVEGSFRARMLADPADALADYGLRESQRSLVESVQESSLSNLVAKLLGLRVYAWNGAPESLAIDGDLA